MEETKTVRELSDAFTKRLHAMNYRVEDHGNLQYTITKDTSNVIAFVSVYYYEGWRVNIAARERSDIIKHHFTSTESFRNNKDLAKLVSLVDQNFPL